MSLSRQASTAISQGRMATSAGSPPMGRAGEDSSCAAFIASVDGLLMGRRTYEEVLNCGAWPYNKPVLILSRSLTATDIRSDLRSKVELTDRSPSQVMNDLSARCWRRAYVAGGGWSARSWMRG